MKSLLNRLFGKTYTIEDYPWPEPFKVEWKAYKINGYDLRGHSKGTMV